MARMPRDTPRIRTVKFLLLTLLSLSLTGCEVGRTMFQYQSGGSPWLGIDLLPRKKESATRISYEAPAPARTAVGKRPALVETSSPPEREEFGRRPLPLDLPRSQVKQESAEPEVTPDIDFSVTSFEDTRF